MCPKVVNIYVHVEELISRLVQLTRKKQTEKVFYLLRLGFCKVSKEFQQFGHFFRAFNVLNMTLPVL